MVEPETQTATVVQKAQEQERLVDSFRKTGSGHVTLDLVPGAPCEVNTRSTSPFDASIPAPVSTGRRTSIFQRYEPPPVARSRPRLFEVSVQGSHPVIHR